MKILVSDPLAEKGIEILRQLPGAQVVVKTGLPKEELISEIADCDALVIRSGTQVDADVLRAGKKLKVVGRAGVGVDNVDLDAATECGVIVMNTPDGNTISTAEHAFCLLMALAMKADGTVKSTKVWSSTRRPSASSAWAGSEPRSPNVGSPSG